MAMIVKFSSRVVEGMITMAKGEYVAQADAHSMPMGSGRSEERRGGKEC